MDEKELVNKIKNSFKAGQSRAEITGKLQKQGYKLEYIDALIKKSHRGKKILLTFVFILLGVLVLGVVGASYFLLPLGKKQDIENPLKNFKVSFGQTGENTSFSNLSKINLEDVEITPDFFTYILSELGANSLKKNPLTQNPPIINFEVDSLEFYSIVKKKIETLEGNSENPDLTFVLDKETLVRIIISENPIDTFKEKVGEGKIIVEQNKDDQTLFLKGYVSLYNSLNS